jgi:phosphoenolpyruvate carboxykinase (ATP)
MLKNKEGVLDLAAIGRENLKRVHRNFPTALLYEHIINNREAQIAHMGPVVTRTGHSKDRALTDRFIVKEPISEAKVRKTGTFSFMTEEQHERLVYRILAYLQNKEVYVLNCMVCNDANIQIPIRIITETAWHSLFARNMYYPIYNQKNPEEFQPAFSVVHIPGFLAIPEIDGTRSRVCEIINMAQKLVVIGGTNYAGNIRQAIFTMANYLLPSGVLPIRCAANMGSKGDIALFLGREGTGKTTLAIDSERSFVGDNFHGWSEKGVFPYERGCYATALGLNPSKSKTIYECTRRFGSLLENVHINPDTRRLDLDDQGLTSNTRVTFSNAQLLNAIHEKGPHAHPKHLFLVACDASGVLPSIARLSPEQTVYAFLSGYTSKFVKTESGEIHPEFSVQFGQSTHHLPPAEYAKLMMERLKSNNTACWFINTGWIGEPCNKTDRIKIEESRSLIHAAIDGSFKEEDFELDPVFQFEVPTKTALFPEKLVNPRLACRDKGEYELRANQLASEFMKNFKQFEHEVPDNMKEMLSQVLNIEDAIEFDELGFSM